MGPTLPTTRVQWTFLPLALLAHGLKPEPGPSGGRSLPVPWYRAHPVEPVHRHVEQVFVVVLDAHQVPSGPSHLQVDQAAVQANAMFPVDNYVSVIDLIETDGLGVLGWTCAAPGSGQTALTKEFLG